MVWRCLALLQNVTVTFAAVQATYIARSVQLNVTQVTGLSPSTTYTYSLNRGDGSAPSVCTTLGTTSNDTSTSAFQAPLPGLAPVSYSTMGTYRAALMVYTASSCPEGATPLPTLPGAGAGAALIPVSRWPASIVHACERARDLHGTLDA